jgi:outer membrane protein assembly factor BamB
MVVSPGSGAVCAYDPDNGKEIWRATYGMGYSVVPRPVFMQEMAFVCSGFSTPVVYAIRVDGVGDVTDSHVVWNTSRGAPKTPSMLPLGQRVLCVSDTGIVTCWDARTGKEHWRGRLGDGVSASPIVADGRVYIVGESGATFVIATEDEFSVLAKNDLGERSLATPAVSGRALFLRTETQLYRIENQDGPS